MVKLRIDNKEIEVEKGRSLLQACLDNGIYIPNLCYLEGKDPPFASCRLCFVQIRGKDDPVTACTVGVEAGMVVQTDTPAVRRLQQTAFRLLLSVHRVDCRHCPANKRCELQRIAKLLKVALKPDGLPQHLKEHDVDPIHPLFDLHPNRCVLCGKCIHLCREKNGYSFLTFVQRGFKTAIGYYGEANVSRLPCTTCTACIDICPVGAITPKADLETTKN